MSPGLAKADRSRRPGMWAYIVAAPMAVVVWALLQAAMVLGDILAAMGFIVARLIYGKKSNAS